MNLAGKPINNTRCKTSVSSALSRACPVHGPCEIQAHWSHHWLTRRGQPSCRVRRVLRGPSLGLDSPELRAELKLGAGGTHLAVLHSPKGTLPTTPSFHCGRPGGGGQRKGALPNSASMDSERATLHRLGRLLLFGESPRPGAGIGSRWPDRPATRLFETARDRPAQSALPSPTTGSCEVLAHGSWLSTRLLEFPHPICTSKRSKEAPHGPELLTTSSVVSLTSSTTVVDASADGTNSLSHIYHMTVWRGIAQPQRCMIHSTQDPTLGSGRRQHRGTAVQSANPPHLLLRERAKVR